MLWTLAFNKRILRQLCALPPPPPHISYVILWYWTQGVKIPICWTHPGHQHHILYSVYLISNYSGTDWGAQQSGNNASEVISTLLIRRQDFKLSAILRIFFACSSYYLGERSKKLSLPRSWRLVVSIYIIDLASNIRNIRARHDTHLYKKCSLLTTRHMMKDIRNIKSEKSRVNAQKPQRNCTFMNSISGYLSQ